jgi:hypothetical protein
LDRPGFATDVRWLLGSLRNYYLLVANFSNWPVVKMPMPKWVKMGPIGLKWPKMGRAQYS